MTYLALGDSYTIGEGVLLHESFPYQVVQLLRREGFMFHAPEIIAKTGWTTDELQSEISATKLLSSYEFVSLLIGVNNQYREKSLEEYRQQMESLLKKSIRLAANRPARVIVLSIPDWGVTPYAANRDRKKIAEGIDDFNLIKKSISLQQQTHFIDITSGSREIGNDVSSIVNDGLHPSGKEYYRWARLVADKMLQEIAK
ncbi:MAG TPA: SGNH/GDSL hydrolase family protein [Chitinophagaceae bacterium]|nr:SGNH/GDSL hydrolase family protein [Chitinophagaceae bacterium]